MNALRTYAIFLLGAHLLAGCVTVKIDERAAFAPPKRELAPATTVAELNARMADRFKGGVDEGVWAASAEPNDGTRLTFRADGPFGRAGRTLPPPIVYRNGFIGEGAGRVAWTMFTEIGDDGKERSAQRPLVVHCAGNAGDRYNSGADYASTAITNADVFVFDYPGYGDTPGPANAANFEASATALTNHIAMLSENRPLVFWGHSLGGFVCARLAASMPQADGLILETTAPNAQAVAKAWTPSYARLFVRTQVVPSLASYDVVSLAAQVKGPVLVLGAAKDGVLPVTLARQVADGLKSAKANVTYKEFPNARHMNVPKQAGFSQTIADFFKSVESQP
jgi:pimeloyl-ACP methyl ester carboxylesterase